MSKTSAFCTASTRDQAERIVNQLKNANFSNNDISVLFPDQNTTRDFAHEKDTRVKEDNILLSVHTENSEEIKRAKETFANAGAQDICTTGGASAPAAPKAARNTGDATPREHGVIVAGD